MKKETGKRTFIRKQAALALTLALAFALCACGEEAGGLSSGNGQESGASGEHSDGREDISPSRANQESDQADSWGNDHTESPEETPVRDFLYIIKNGEAHITSYDGWDTDIVVPSRIEGCPVTVIGSAFGGRERSGQIERIVLPESVREIESLAFNDCNGLREIVVPDTVEKIGSSAFAGCKSLTGIKLPDGVTYLGRSAFSGCESLVSFDFPAGITEVPEMVFCECTSLYSVTIPDGVTRIGAWAFTGCESLSGLTIPAGVTEIGEVAFSGCKNLGKLSLPGTVKKVGNNAFGGCEKVVVIYDGEEYGYDRLDYLNIAINRPSGGLVGRYRVLDGEEPWWCRGDLDITGDDDGSFQAAFGYGDRYAHLAGEGDLGRQVNMVDFGSMGGGILGTVVMTRTDMGIRVEFRYSAYIVNTDADPSNDEVETCTFVKVLDLD